MQDCIGGKKCVPVSVNTLEEYAFVGTIPVTVGNEEKFTSADVETVVGLLKRKTNSHEPS
jgi:hypothetical protein